MRQFGSLIVMPVGGTAVSITVAGTKVSDASDGRGPFQPSRRFHQ